MNLWKNKRVIASKRCQNITGLFSDDNMTNEMTCVVLDDCSFIVADPGGSSFNVTFICHATLFGMIAER